MTLHAYAGGNSETLAKKDAGAEHIGIANIEGNRSPPVNVVRDEHVRSRNDVGELEDRTWSVPRDGDCHLRCTVRRRENDSDSIAAIPLNAASDSTILYGHRQEVHTVDRFADAEVEDLCLFCIDRSRVKQRDRKRLHGNVLDRQRRRDQGDGILPRLQHKEAIITQVVGHHRLNQRSLAQTILVGRLESLNHGAGDDLTAFVRKASGDRAARSQHKANTGKHLSGSQLLNDVHVGRGQSVRRKIRSIQKLSCHLRGVTTAACFDHVRARSDAAERESAFIARDGDHPALGVETILKQYRRTCERLFRYRIDDNAIHRGRSFGQTLRSLRGLQLKL